MVRDSTGHDRRSFLGSVGGLSVLAGAGALSHTSNAAEPDPEAEETGERLAIATIDALEGAYGVHPRQRRNHTKGVGVSGSFIGNPALSRYTRSRLFSGNPVDVVARFSIAGGDPEVADADRSPRGLGVEFRLPDGALHHMTMLNTPVFFARTPQTFIDKFVSLTIDPATGKANPALFAEFNRTHADIRGQVQFLNDNNPPRSYAEEAYFGIHTFFLVDDAGGRTKFKFHFEPRDGIHRLTAAEMAAAPQNFLEAALVARMARGSAEWDLIVTIGEPDDEEIDPTVPWPSDRRQIKAGVLKLRNPRPSEKAGSFGINFDPLMLADGIAPGGDPILLFRSPSYAVSHTRRLQGL